MKKLVSIFTFILALGAFANETHTPQFECISLENGEKKFLLIGNDFPQTTDLDWSDEVILATPEEYYTTGIDKDYLFKFETKSESGFITLKNKIDLGNDKFAQTHLLLNEEYVLTYSVELPFENCSTAKECLQEEKFQCEKTPWNTDEPIDSVIDSMIQ